MLNIGLEEIRIPVDTETFASDIARFSPAGRGARPADRVLRARARSVWAQMHSGYGDLRLIMPMHRMANHSRFQDPQTGTNRR